MRIQRQGARGSGVVELGLAREHFETRDVEIEFGAREARARVDEFDLADHALVALAAGDAEARARGFGARLGGGQRIGAGIQPVERLLDFELHLLHQLVVLRLRAARDGIRLAHGGASRATIEQGPVEQQRDRGVVAAAGRTGIPRPGCRHPRRAKASATDPPWRLGSALRWRASGVPARASSGRLSSAAWRSSASARVVAVTPAPTSAFSSGVSSGRFSRKLR